MIQDMRKSSSGDWSEWDTYHRSMERERRAKWIIAGLSLIIAALVTGMVTWKVNVTAQEKTQEYLAREVLRFHVLANSDSEEDQRLKMQVKEAVVAYLESELPQNLDVESTKEWAKRHTDELEGISSDVIEAKGYAYPVSAAVTTCYFPRKSYGDVTFPKGNYTALRVEIGAAEGHNWWSLLYPNLCFMDAVHIRENEEKKVQLGNILAEELCEGEEPEPEVKIKWYLQEILNKKK